MSKEIDDHGYFVRTNESMVKLKFTRIRDLELEGFNEQNVLGELTIEAKPDGLRITLWSLHGLGGSFMCDSAEVVDVSPWGA